MDTTILQQSLGQQQQQQPLADDANQRGRPPATSPTTNTAVTPSMESTLNDNLMDEDSDGGGDGAKRPRLRLAHACDRCRKRKIRCDTQQPCGPCSATKNECTFNTPSRRVAKPKSSETRSSSAGVKRPHSPSRNGSGGAYQASLEARLATLESLLRDVPPNVHNAYLSTLDARLGAGQGAGLAQGKGDGVGISSEALGAGPMLNGSSASSPSLSSLFSSLKSETSAAAPVWQNTTGISGAWAGGRPIRRTAREERGSIDEMSRRMETLSFFYEDEIGQAKWQGRCRRGEGMPRTRTHMR
jgi:hypothetical protein